MERNQRGITLIALVITIIILLILAGITLTLTIGKSGIINKAIQAKENTIQASKEEEEALNRLWAELESEGENGSVDSDEEDKKDILTAEERHILSGYKAYSGSKLLIGTMVNRGSIEKTINAGESYTIPEGYHDGTGYVAGNSLASQTEATATAEDIVEGKTAWVNGELITGNGVNSKVTSGDIVTTSIKFSGTVRYAGDVAYSSQLPATYDGKNFICLYFIAYFYTNEKCNNGDGYDTLRTYVQAEQNNRRVKMYTPVEQGGNVTIWGYAYGVYL